MKKSKSILSLIMCMVMLMAVISTANAGLFDFLKPSTKCKTKYPIILVHGVCGFDKIAGFVDYWYGIPQKLSKEGATVRSAKLSAQSNNEARGEQLLDQILDYLADTGAKKVNIIAHSHGCTTSRYAAYMRPDLVASLTLIAGPHKGSPVADWANEEVPPVIQDIGFSAGDLLGKIIDLLSGNDGLEQDTKGLMKHFTQEGIAYFNANYPSSGVPTCDDAYCRGSQSETFNVNGTNHVIKYYSWTGNKQMTNIFDALDYLWPVLHLINKHYGMNEDDGFVGVNGSHFGLVLNDSYPWNHADEVNHLLGIRQPFSADPRDVIAQHASRLKGVGL